MRHLEFIFISCLMALSALVSAQDRHDTIVLGEEIVPKDTTRTHRLKNYTIAPKGEWQCGLSVMYADFSSNNSEYMLLAQNVDASASVLRLSPDAAYTFANNHAVGARFQYTNARGAVDSATADLLGNFSTTLEGMRAKSMSMSGCIFERTYVGLDSHGRVGVFWDYTLGYTRTKSQFTSNETSDSYSIRKKVHLGFAPGIVYFPMNNLSVQVSLCLADLSYYNVSTYSGGERVGTRNAWKAQASLNVLDLSFGLTIHL